jgi:hypothetical protein
MMHLLLATAQRKFPAQFLGLQAELDTKEDFLSCAQREKETLPNFYRRFLQLKAHTLKVSNDQVIAPAIKASHTGSCTVILSESSLK